MNRIAIRRETRDRWARCAPLVPEDIVDLVVEDIPILVEHSEERVFVDAAYAAAGAAVVDSADDADVVMAIHEVRRESIDGPRTWIFFSDTAAGEPENMPVLARIVDTGGTLLDYELIVNDEGDRLIAFDDLGEDADAIALSQRFSDALTPMVPTLARAALDAPTPNASGLPRILRRACIAWRGELTEPFRGLRPSIEQYGTNA